MDDIIYYDRFDESKKWDKLLFLPDRIIQTSELNEIQSVFDWKLKKISNVFINDGTIISGCDLNPPSEFPGGGTVSEGYVYINGKIIYTEKYDIKGEITGSGIEWVYVNVIKEFDTTQSISQEIEEPNFDIVGAHREILRLEFCDEKNKTDSSKRLAYFKDGVPTSQRMFAGGKIIEFVAERSFEENGNFLVSGADLTLKENSEHPSLYDVIISPFTVFLKGKQFTFNVAQTISVDKSIDLYESQDFVQVGQSIGSEGTISSNIFEVKLDYVKELILCIYPIRRTISVNHSVVGGTDAVDIDGSIAEVIKIEGNEIFKENIDFRVDYDNIGIDWSLKGDEPSAGSTYSIDLIYYRTIDFTVVVEEGSELDPNNFVILQYPNANTGDYRQANITIIDQEYCGLRESHIINIEYFAYKYRIDAIVLDNETGLIGIVKGESSEKSYSILKPGYRSDFFPLYLIELFPGEYSNPDTAVTTDKRVFRTTQKGFNIMLDDLRDVQVNMSLVKLDADAAKISAGGTMNGVFTDSFENQDESNTGYSGKILEFPDSFDAAFDDGTLTLSIELNEDATQLERREGNVKQGKKSYFLDFTEKMWLDQPLASMFMSVIPYDFVYGMHSLELSPANDFWVDHKKLTVTERGPNQVIRKVMSSNFIPGRGRTRKSLGDKVDFAGVSTKLQVRKYARQRDVKISGRYWFIPGGLDSIKLRCSVSGIEVDDFNEKITLRNDTTGSFEATFKIPPNVENGIIPVRIWCDPENIEATTNYFAQGTMMVNTRIKRRIKVVQDTVRGNLNVMQQRRFFRDPIAQSFRTDKEMFLTAVSVFFRTKDLQAPVKCILTEMDNGYPTEDYIGEVDLDSSVVNVSKDSSVETKFEFPDPVYLKGDTEYAFIIKSSSKNYVCYIVKQGGTDYLTQQFILSQAYDGVFYTSANASTWTAVQDRDFKFCLYRADFNKSGTMITTQQDINDSWFMIMADIAEYKDTDCDMYYNQNGEWNKISLGDKMQLTKTGLAAQNQVKFVFQTEDSWLSPIVGKELGCLYWKYENQGQWYSRRLDFEDHTFNIVKVRLYGITEVYPFSLNIVASIDAVDWFKYSDETFSPVVRPIDLDIGSYMYEYEFDLSDNFNTFLARYLMLNIDMSGSGYDGNDTPRFFDLRVTVYSKI